MTLKGGDDVFSYRIGSYFEFESCDRDYLELASWRPPERGDFNFGKYHFLCIIQVPSQLFFGKVPLGDDSTSSCSYAYWTTGTNKEEISVDDTFLVYMVHISKLNTVLFQPAWLCFRSYIYIYSSGLSEKDIKFRSEIRILSISQELHASSQGIVGCTPNLVPMVFIVFSRNSWGWKNP